MAPSLKSAVALIQQFIDRSASLKDLENFVKAAKDKDARQVKLPSLQISSLHLSDVQTMFDLRLVTDDEELWIVPPVTMPTELMSILRRIQNAVARSPANEAIVRMTIDSLLIFAHEIAAASLSDQQVNTISIQAEKTWKYTSVKHRGKEYVLLGRPDYGAWYGDPQHDALNLVVVGAKRADASSNGLPQALAYMACVHKKRLEAENLHCRVHGVSVDSQGFHFLKINDDGTWSQRFVLVWSYEYEQVLGLLVHMFKQAAKMSPTSSKRSSRHRQEHSSESDLSFNADADMEDA